MRENRSVIADVTDVEDVTTIRLCRDEAEEANGIAEFWEAARHRTIVGYNVKGFDLRFLVQRSRLLGVPYPDLDFGKYSRKGGIEDLYLLLTFGDGTYDQGAMRRTLGAFCRRFGLPVDDGISGKDIPALVAAGEWEKVESHCRSDVELTVALARKLGIVNATTIRGSVSPIVFDLETCGLPNAVDFLEPVTPDARLKDPEKIAADILAKTDARMEKLALDWNVGRIAAIGWWL